MARYRLRLLLQEFDLPMGDTILGRSPECRVTIEDPLVSREHAQISVSADRVVFRDLGSRNGSKHNGRWIQGEVVLQDGDRLRIGTQELLFVRIESPRRPGRPTGSLRYCLQCKLPYPAEAASCSHCGYTPMGEEVTVAEPSVQRLQQEFDTQTWSFDLHLELLDKALSVRRWVDAERTMHRIISILDEKFVSNQPIEFKHVEPALIGAIRLSAATGAGSWVGWVFAVLEQLRRLPSPAVMTHLATLTPHIFATTGTTFERYVGYWSDRKNELSNEQRMLIEHLFAWRDSLDDTYNSSINNEG